jgi:hypothetical protein
VSAICHPTTATMLDSPSTVRGSHPRRVAASALTRNAIAGFPRAEPLSNSPKVDRWSFRCRRALRTAILNLGGNRRRSVP